MASIKTMLRGYICDDREKNWSREYASREISKHKQKGVIDHPDKSVTTDKLQDSCVTENKLAEDVLERFLNLDENIENVKAKAEAETNARKNEDEKKADCDLSNVDNSVFKKKAEDAGVAGAVKSVNGKTGDVVLKASDVGAYTIEEVDDFGDRVFKALELIQQESAMKDLSNVSNEDFLAKLNAVLPDGDEVSY